MGKKRNAYTVLVGRYKRKIPIGRQRHRWAYNIGSYEVGCEGMVWTSIDRLGYSG
jgi:hypothetical protein